MKQSFWVKVQEWFARRSKTPWAAFETNGPTNGILEFSISWNDAFVKMLKLQGFPGGNDEEVVQMFFLSTRVLPENLITEDVVNPENMPRLTSEMNELRS